MTELSDPFGNLPNYLIFTRKDCSLKALRLINETRGRWYLNHYAYLTARDMDYSNLTLQDFLFWIGAGGAYELKMQEYGAANLSFPRTPFTEGFINWLVELDPQQPLQQCEGCILTRHMGRFILKSLHLKEHPDLADLIIFGITNTLYSTHWQEIWQKIHPDVPLPEKDKEWKKIKFLDKSIHGLAWKFSEGREEGWAEKVGKGWMKNRKMEAEDKESEYRLRLVRYLIPSELYKKPEKIIEAGMQDKLRVYLMEALKHDILDELRRDKKIIPISKLLSEKNVPPGKEEEFIDSLAIPVDSPEQEDATLESLGLKLDIPAPKELLVLRDILQGIKEGYSFDSKKDGSFKQRWGKNYEKNVKAWQRAKAKLRKQKG
jgi:hypothetical protein